MSDPWLELLDAAASAWPPARWRDVGVVVACSGGADSVALLRVLMRLRAADDSGEGGAPPQPDLPPRPARGFLIAAHFNHRLRGAESDGDEAFVADLASGLGIAVETGRAAEPVADEASMRAAREDFLRHVAERAGARYIVAAHSADDNVETMLHHLMRGTGPAGLAGIAPHRAVGPDVVLVRPLLAARREAIRAALRSIGQRWREDLSNADRSYRRNWIRSELIPLIQSQYPSAVDAMVRAVESQRSQRAVIERLAEQWLHDHVGDRGGAVRIERGDPPEPALLIAALQTVWRRRRWPRRDMTNRHWQRMARTVRGEADERYALPGAVDVVARGRAVILRGPDASPAGS